MVDRFNDIEKTSLIRNRVADRTREIVEIFTQAESEGEKISGRLGLEADIERLAIASENFREGVFKLLVLGDVKRGKSTFLNALLGQNLLPCDVTPCTALLTVIKYGATEKVTIYYRDSKRSQEISFTEFKQRYTIDPAEARVLERDGQLAFPDISHAVLEHPLPLLGRGIEFIDTPGLNDREALNQLSLNYTYNCHAILFVLSASQPCTLEERRYIQNYLKDRGLTIFFLVNGWDRIRDGIVDPENTEELDAAEEKLRQVFRTNLNEYCGDRYSERVFEISALNALRLRLKNSDASLEGTGFPEFLDTLNHFLTTERFNSELDRLKKIARHTCDRYREAIERRIPLLDRTVEELKEKQDLVKEDFERLDEICRQLQQEIKTTRDREAKAIADDFKSFILNLETTFTEDFLNSQPDLDFNQFLNKNNRESFYVSFKRAFERYINDRLAAWEFIAKQKIATAFTELESKTKEYQLEYAQVVGTMNYKLLGYRFHAEGKTYKDEQAATLVDVVADIFSAIPDSLNGAVGSFNVFWQSVFSQICVLLVIQAIGLVFTGVTLSILGGILASAGIAVIQAEFVRRQFLETTKKEFKKYLPQIAEEQWQPVYEAVGKCFDVYEHELVSRINSDIESRQAELDNLLQQKQSHFFDREAETKRFQEVEAKISALIADLI
ncbi:MAG: dynamin family protein [Xenococcaceae cyanobacterium]